MHVRQMTAPRMLDSPLPLIRWGDIVFHTLPHTITSDVDGSTALVDR